MFKGIDLFSDTLSQPTKAMKQAMMEAPLGDEQKGEDPTTLALEEKIAKMLGHESALFFPSATMANEIAIKLLCEPGDELIASANCHLFNAETGGPAVHAQVLAKPIRTVNGVFSGEEVEDSFRWAQGPHYPKSALVSVENTANGGGGTVWQKKEIDSVLEKAKSLRLKTHLDGSRLFNAAVKGGYSAKEIASSFDAVTICFSKGLGCPTGAVLAMPRELWPKARRQKQLFGGAMRQSGMLSAACLYALDHHIERLSVDHENASLLSQILSQMPFLKVETNAKPSNMVFFSFYHPTISPKAFSQLCVARGLRFGQTDANRFRAVTYMDITSKDIQEVGIILKGIASELK